MRELIESGIGLYPPLPARALNLKPIAEGEVVSGPGAKSPAFESLKLNLNQSLKNVFSGEGVKGPPKIRPILVNKSKVPANLSPEPPMTEFQLAKAKGKLSKSVGFASGPQSMILDQTTFHLNEFRDDEGWEVVGEEVPPPNPPPAADSLTNFAGVKDIFSRGAADGPRQIMSDKGTIRGVKNRVRDGIATFLQSTDTKVRDGRWLSVVRQGSSDFR
jgi:hypothetical protein